MLGQVLRWSGWQRAGLIVLLEVVSVVLVACRWTSGSFRQAV